MKARAKCKCVCGKIVVLILADIRSGNTKSCGCWRREFGKLQSIKYGFNTHGDTHTPEYITHQNMIQRCYNKEHAAFKYYGSRGITVCYRWVVKPGGYENFIADMKRRPSSKYSLDRINVDGNYEPSNCRWATRTVQRLNQRKRSTWRASIYEELSILERRHKYNKNKRLK